MGAVKLGGCLYEGRKAGALWLDSLDAYHKLAKSVGNKADALGDSVLGSLVPGLQGVARGVAAKAAAKAKGTLRERFFPDAIRVEVREGPGSWFRCELALAKQQRVPASCSHR